MTASVPGGRKILKMETAEKNTKIDVALSISEFVVKTFLITFMTMFVDGKMLFR